MAETERIGESGKNPTRNLGYPDTEKNVEIGLQRDVTMEGRLRRGGQSQGNTEAEPSMPKSNYEATMAETKRIGDFGKTPIRTLGYLYTEKNVETGLQRDTTMEGTAKRGGQNQGNTKAEPKTPKSNCKDTKPRGSDSFKGPPSGTLFTLTQIKMLRQASKETPMPRTGHQGQTARPGHTNQNLKNQEPSRVFVVNLDYSTTKEDIKRLSGKFSQSPTSPWGFAYATLTTHQHAEALETKGTMTMETRSNTLKKADADANNNSISKPTGPNTSRTEESRDQNTTVTIMKNEQKARQPQGTNPKSREIPIATNTAQR